MLAAISGLGRAGVELCSSGGRGDSLAAGMRGQLPGSPLVQAVFSLLLPPPPPSCCSLSPSSPPQLWHSGSQRPFGAAWMQTALGEEISA